MSRLLLAGIAVIVLAIAFEHQTGRSVLGGFKAATFGSWSGAGAGGGFAGGYGMAVDAGRSVGGSVSGLAGSISGSMGAAGN